MGADEPDDGVAHLPVRPVSESASVRGGLVARVRIVGQAQVGAQHIDAGLPVVLPVISQARHGVHAGQPDRWLGIAELGCDRGEPLVEDPRPVMDGVGLGDLLPPVGHDQRDQRAGAGHRREDQLQHPDRVVQRGWPVVTVPATPSRTHASPASPARPTTATVKPRPGRCRDAIAVPSPASPCGRLLTAARRCRAEAGAAS